MNKSDYFVTSLKNGVGTIAYVCAVAWLMSNAGRIFGGDGKPDNVLAPIFMLTLFLVSASVTGYLVIGKPVQLYWDGQKKEAVTLLFATIGWLAAFLVAVGTALALR